MKRKLNILEYIQIYEFIDICYIYDWIWCKDIIIDKEYVNFLKLYNSNISLKDNLESFWFDFKLSKDFILEMIKNRILFSSIK